MIGLPCCEQGDCIDLVKVNHPTFVRGMVQAFDIGGVMCEPTFFYEDDIEALMHDWHVIGQDLWQAIVRFDEKHNCGLQPTLKFKPYVATRD